MILGIYWGKIEEIKIKIKIMNVVEVNEKQWATLLILSAMLNYEISEENAFMPFVLIRGETRKIRKNIEVGDISYEIESGLFDKIVFEFSYEGIINTPMLTHKGYSYSIKDRAKVGQRIVELNSVGITLDKIRDHYRINDDFVKHNDKKNRLGKEKLFSIPEGKSLKNVVLIFLGDHKIKISIDDETQKHHLFDMGLLKTKDGKNIEKESLKFLLQLSANDGVYPLKNLSYVDRERATIRKKELKKIFQNAFGTKEDPFYRYKKEKDEHKIKIKLIPPNILRAEDYRDKNIHDDKIEKEKNPFADIEEYQDEQCPLM